MKTTPTLILIFMASIAILASGCKKKTPGPDPNKLYDVSYAISGFSVSDIPFKLSSSDKSKKPINGQSATGITSAVPVSGSTIKSLYCKIYNSAGKNVLTARQSSTDENFGNFALRLPLGTYTVVFVGSDDKLRIFGNGSTDPNNNELLSDRFQFMNEDGQILDVRDTFLKRLPLVVTGDVNASVILDRIVGQISYVIEDKLPASVKRIGITLEPYLNIYPISGAKPYRTGSSSEELRNLVVTIPANQIGTTNFTSKIPVFNVVDPFSVKLTAYSGDGSVIAETKILNVTARANQITMLTGKLFGGNGSSGGGFNIVIDPEWNAGPPEVIKY